MTKLESANSVISDIQKRTDSIIIMCSLGKDSLVCLDMCYGKFEHIYCVFMYFVNGLEHIEQWVRWVKARYPKVEFIQIPHWNLSYILRSGLYCVPNPNVKLIKLADVSKAMRRKLGVEYIVLGMKKADSMNRRLMLNTYKEGNYINNGNVFPLAEWNQREILSYMKHHQLPQPVRYSKDASNGVGLNEACFLWMREHFPQDLELIYQTFPMSRRILIEYDIQQERKKKEEEQQEE